MPAAPPQIALLDLVTGDRKILVRGTRARYVESGHLVFVADGILQAVPFDLDTRTISGQPVPVLQQFAMIGSTAMVLDTATNGTLVYVPGSATSRLPVWVDREGRRENDQRRRPISTVSNAAALAVTAGVSHFSTSPAAANMTYGFWTSNEEPWKS